MNKSKNAGLALLWVMALLMTCVAVSADRRFRKLNRETFSLDVQASGKFDCKVYAQNWAESTGGAEICYDQVTGIRLLGDTAIYKIRNKVDFVRGDSVYIVSDVALPRCPANCQMIRDALGPGQNSVRWASIICLILWFAAVWKTWNRLYY